MTLKNRDVVNSEYEVVERAKQAAIKFLEKNTLKAFEKATGETHIALNRLLNSNSAATKIDEDLCALTKDQQTLDSTIASAMISAEILGKSSKMTVQICSSDSSNSGKIDALTAELKKIEDNLNNLKLKRSELKEKFGPICTQLESVNNEVKALSKKLEDEKTLPAPKNDIGNLYKLMLGQCVDICGHNKRIIDLRYDIYDLNSASYKLVIKVIDDNEKLIPLIKQRIADLQNRANNTATTAHVQSTLQSQQPKTVSGSSKPVPVKAVSAVTPTAVKQAIPSSSSTGKQASNGLQITTNGKPLQGALYATPTQQTKPLTHPVAAQKQISVKP